jgi:formamidopyrimidine-DNA glycosylase
MPELPEVENLRLGLARKILGQKIKRIEIRKPKLVSGKGNMRVVSQKMAKAFIEGLTGETITDIDRRAKNLLFRTKRGRILLVHLKMSGQFVYRERGRNLVEGGHPIEISEKDLPNKHTHLIFELSKGTLFYNDTRMFGYLLYYPDAARFEKENHFGGLGLEPLDPAFTLEYFRTVLKDKKGKLKTVLMNQSVVTGLGNIYADEVCFMASVRPVRQVSSLTSGEIAKVYEAIRVIIPKAIEQGGSSVATYRLLDESRGNYAREHKVYGKTGERCMACDKPLRTVQVNNRTTVFCGYCQK